MGFYQSQDACRKPIQEDCSFHSDSGRRHRSMRPMDLQSLWASGFYINRQARRGYGAKKAERQNDMILIVIEFVVVLIGLAITPMLFYRFPRLPEVKSGEMVFPKVSVIIPARNEEHNLPLLLNDLNGQSFIPFEIICVDDDSSDLTAQIAEASGARVLSLHDKPDGWTGKSWACQNGADAAKGELLVFLDADVRLGHNAILRLMQAYSDCGCTISAQPFHKTEKAYEQLSMLFNFIQIAANGTALPKPLGVGLYGPVILIPKSEYNRIGGHESVKMSIVEDMALGHRLKENGLSYLLFIGDKELSFRMYGDGLKALLQGWLKNMAAGAAKTTPSVFVMVFFWITSLISVPLHVIYFSISGNSLWLVMYSLLYIVWATILSSLSKRIGQFRPLATVLFPLQMVVFLGVFAVSVFKKIFRLNVIWKGRAVSVEGKTCK